MALSKVIGVYRLTQDVELKYLPSGSAVAKLHLVNSSKYKAQDGTQKEDTCFIDGTVFGKLAEVANQYLKKGSKVYVIADLKQDNWTANDGQNKSKHTLKIDSFEMLDSKPNENQRQRSQGNYQSQQIEQSISEINIDYDDSSEIPF